MNDRVRDLAIGVAGLAGLGAAAWLAMAFGELATLRETSWQLVLRVDHASGLREGSAVEVNGVPVGTVRGVGLEDDPEWPVVLTVAIDETVRIPLGMVPLASSSLLGGASSLELVVPSTPASADRAWLPRDGTAEVRGRLGLRLVEQIRQELDRRTAPFEAAAARLEALAESWARVGDAVRAELLPQDAAALEAGAIPNLRTTLASVGQATEEAQATLASVRRWLDDEALRARVDGALDGVERLGTSGAATVERVEGAVARLEADASDAAGRVALAADELAGLAASARALTARIEAGEGTLGQLAVNPDLYRSLDSAVARLDRALVEVERLLAAVREEGVRIGP